MKISDIEQKIIIYGENHSNPDEVDRIRNSIVEFNPEVILHEIYWEEEDFFAEHLPDTMLLPLEDDVTKESSLKKQFAVREQSMIENLEKAKEKYNKIAVVVGDTHLRTIETDELGKVSPINYWASLNGAKIVRSSYPEIK